MDKIRNAGQWIVQKMIFIILAVCAACVPVTMLVYMLFYPELFCVSDWIWMPVAAALLVLCFLAAEWLKDKKEWQVVLLMISATTLCYALLNLVYNTQPCSDYGAIWHSAKDMANGSFDVTDPSSYTYSITWNTGMALLESWFIRLFGENFVVIKLLNVICMQLISWLVYLIAKSKVTLAEARYAYVFTGFFVSWLLTAPQFTNHHVGLIFILLGIYFIDKNRYGWAALAGVMTALQNTARPMGIIMVVTVICLTVYRIFKERKWLPACGKLALYLAMYYICTLGINTAMVSTQYLRANAGSADTNVAKIAIGLFGLGTMADFKEQKEIELGRTLTTDDPEYQASLREYMIDQITHHPLNVAKSVSKKMVQYLGVFDYQFENTFDHEESVYTQYPWRATYTTGWFQYGFYLLLALIGYTVYARRRKKDYDMSSLEVFFIGNTLIYIFIEAWSSFRFEGYPLILMMVGVGACRLRTLGWKQSWMAVRSWFCKPFSKTHKEEIA